MTIALYQKPLFEQSMDVRMIVSKDHELVRLTKELNWSFLIKMAMDIRSSKIKADSGPDPRYRQLLGALVLMAVKKITFREAEDLAAHYAPARYLCDLMDSDWHMDHVTIFEFSQMMGHDGMRRFNEYVIKQAQEKGLADPSRLMSDTTAQEAKIPYPNEVGLMARYAELIQRPLKKAGQKFVNAKAKVKEVRDKIKGLVRNSHLFAKTKEQKRKVAKKLYHVVKDVQKEVQKALASCGKIRGKAQEEIFRLSKIMETLLPQILHFIETGFVAPKKIIHFGMPELYSIVRGKAGKAVEFGLKWGINRIGGGFIQGFVVNGGKHVSDQKFCRESVKVHAACCGKVPDVFGFDRGGWSKANVRKIQKMGVKHVGIAPKGKADWAVSDKMKDKIKNERAQVEGSIGTIKKDRYGFNKPDVRSIEAMLTCGQRAILGSNLKKLMRKPRKLALATT